MKKLLIFASLSGFLAVIAGAIGNHLLAGGFTATSIEQFNTALRYHQLYSVLLAALGLSGLKYQSDKWFNLSCLLFLLGLLVFSGSLYLSVFFAAPVFNYATPFGGVLLMIAWLLLMVFIIKLKD